MSQIQYRQRLRDRQEAERQGGVSSFQPQSNLGRITMKAPKVTEGAPAATQSPAQVKATAEMLVALSPEEYDHSLRELEQTSPEFYEQVVAELTAMNETAGTGEGDGFDLSGVSAAVSSGLPAPAPSAQQIAQGLASVDEHTYTAQLEQLERENPALYAAVTEELVRMNEQ